MRKLLSIFPSFGDTVIEDAIQLLGTRRKAEKEEKKRRVHILKVWTIGRFFFKLQTVGFLLQVAVCLLSVKRKPIASQRQSALVSQSHLLRHINH